jgi:hypothetical protein
MGMPTSIAYFCGLVSLAACGFAEWVVPTIQGKMYGELAAGGKTVQSYAMKPSSTQPASHGVIRHKIMLRCNSLLRGKSTPFRPTVVLAAYQARRLSASASALSSVRRTCGRRRTSALAASNELAASIVPSAS